MYTDRSHILLTFRYIILQRNRESQDKSLDGRFARRHQRKRSLASSSGDVTEVDMPQENICKTRTRPTMSQDPMDVGIGEDDISMVLGAHNAMDNASAQRRNLEPRQRVLSKAADFSTNQSGLELQDRWTASAMSSLERSSDFSLLPNADMNFSQPMWLNPSVNQGLNDKRRGGRPAEAPSNAHSSFGLLSADSYPSTASHSLSDASVCPSDLMTLGGPHGCPNGKGWDLHGGMYRHRVPLSTESVARTTPCHNLQDPERVEQSPKQDSVASSPDGHMGVRDSSRKSRMVLEHVQPDLVERVLSLVLMSDSTIDVKISGQDSTD